MREWEYLGSGTTRHVFAHGPNWVIKLPKGLRNSPTAWDAYYETLYRDRFSEGVGANYREARLSYEFRDEPDHNGICYARCRITEVGVLVMERVEVWTPYCGWERPRWADYVDGGQVGRARDGRIVAYDYGDLT